VQLHLLVWLTRRTAIGCTWTRNHIRAARPNSGSYWHTCSIFVLTGNLKDAPSSSYQALGWSAHVTLSARTSIRCRPYFQELLAFKEHGWRPECTGDRSCTFRQVRFGGVGEAGTGACDEEVSRDIVSQLLINSGIEGSSTSTSSVSRVFGGISGCMIRRYVHHCLLPWPR
jgi:hypothetical protein